MEYKKRIVKNKIVLFVFICIISFNAAACQPTPENAAVVYGRDLQQKIERSEASVAAYEAPEHWNETLDMKGSDIKIEIDADIIVPDVTSFPVNEVEQDRFSKEKLQPLLDYFVAEKEFFKSPEPTKADYEELLIKAKQNVGDEWAQDDQWLKELEDLINKAPESVELEYITNWDITEKEQRIHGFIDTEDGHYTAVSVEDDWFGYMGGEVINNVQLKYDGKKIVRSLSISEDEAIAAADAVFDELGIENMTVYSMEMAKLFPITSYHGFNTVSEQPESQGYFIRFVPEIGGIAARAYEPGKHHYKDEFAYTAPFYPEEISVYIDESGVLQYFCWYDPLTTIEVLSDNVDILPLGDVQERIQDMLIFKYSYDKCPITVDLIEMKMTLIQVRDEPTKAMYVPAWYISCSVELGMLVDEFGNSTKDSQTLVLNAIDGGRVLENPPDPEIEAIMQEERDNES